MSQKEGLFWTIAFQNVGCVFAYFCGAHKNPFGYNFVATFK